jgi:hypothetical protein
LSRCDFIRIPERRGAPSAARGRRFAVVLAIGLIGLCLAAGTAEATVVPWMGLEEVTGQAEVVVLGKVETTESRWSDDGRIIVTEVTVSVERALKGGPRATVVVETPGGTLGDRTLVASGAPVFARGERVVLFLREAGDGARPGGGRLAVVGWSQGRFRVRRDPRTGRDLVQAEAAGAAYLDRQGKPVAPEGAGGGPVELQQFLLRVETLLRRGDQGGSP